MSDATPDAPLPPYVIEGARSSRAKCKACRRAIEKGTLRLGVLVEGPYGTGYMWHHLACAARRMFDKLEEAYALEAWSAAAEPPADVPSLAELGKLRDEAQERRNRKKQLPYAEVAPTGRARCKHSGDPIEQGRLRVVLGREVSFGQQVRTTPINVLPEHVAAALRAPDGATPVEGFLDDLRAHSTDLTAAQLEQLLAEIGDVD
jgi:hypothetical protein